MASITSPANADEQQRDDDESLDTDARVLAYLRAVMLESGDDPHAIAVAIKNVEAARARLQRKGPSRITSNLLEPSRLVTKRAS